MFTLCYKKQQKLTIYCRQYDIRNRCPRLHQDDLRNHISTKTINFLLFNSKQHQKLTIYC